jgi:hypothetical protein
MNRPGSGRVQKRVRWTFIASNGAAVPFRTLAERCYPRLDRLELKQRWSIYRALARYGTPVRRGWWAPHEELRRRIGR